MSSANTKVRFISTSSIRPATHTESIQRLDLTPWELSHLALNTIQKGLLFHKPNDDTWITQLKTSLSCTLDHFFPLAGRLATETHDDNTISVFILCNDAGAEFVHATVDLTVADILDPLYVPHIVDDFFRLNDTINFDGQSRPLLSVQVTELTDGIFLGCTMNHSVVDGSSFWHFINSWSEISRNRSAHQISRPPNFNRCFHNLPIRIPVPRSEKLTRSHMPALEQRVFYFSPQNIAKLKAKANLDITNNNIIISSLQAVLAHVWRAVTRARKVDSDVEVIYMVLTGNRARLNPPLHEDYFGSATGSGLASAKATELVNQGLGFGAELLNRGVNLHNDAMIRDRWDNWVKEPKFYLDGLPTDKPLLITGSSPRFNMYGNDFGWGCPIGVRSGCGNKFDGKMTVFPGVAKGSMEIEACVSPKTLTALGEDSEFMQFVEDETPPPTTTELADQLRLLHEQYDAFKTIHPDPHANGYEADNQVEAVTLAIAPRFPTVTNQHGSKDMSHGVLHTLQKFDDSPLTAPKRSKRPPPSYTSNSPSSRCTMAPPALLST
ncbi:hypothetical protein IFM89_015734 [Coptis chinensis]|uniref:HXXXD-type acyl-transferase family protein n=1 Tax=Coptis chinensis TaxID=261450 RepID=A0A835I3N4_9MAGN|nr:hypothetical protein IFM89_015734 [Coptis chinensis]